ncbi:sugar phosphate isomerase/epimerase family protein [Paenibacillus cremeus]|uniref:Sugar phosphate isomerase/epimerase n=1 Tax=Paenibacillus cremeus TaxID=2163881 RepID=A0A559KG82_9BACL|nr:sugar phosphate isomerase/epimerase [Paenibacillus cremeus]TVY11126.1 sugar phosphate isomerase/epimerase [Paenibacillus cremeus]
MRFQRSSGGLWEMPALAPGLQMYSVRSAAQTDFLGTLKKIADMGYKMVEFFGYGGLPAAELKKALKALGLTAVSTYVSPEDLEHDLKNQIDYAQKLGLRYIVTGFPKERFDDPSKFPELVSSLQKYGREMKKYGIQLLYHAHEHEYVIKDGHKIIDKLLAAVGTDVMKLAVDLYWVKKAGLDPKGTLLAYKGMVPLIHVKDMDTGGGFTEVGRGTIDWPSIFGILKATGVKYYFVEQDESAHPLESAQMSLEYLKSIGVA